MPRGRGGVAHEGLEIVDVIPGCGGGWTDGDGGEEKLQVALDALFPQEFVIVCPVSHLWKPHLLVWPLAGERGVVGNLLV